MKVETSKNKEINKSEQRYSKTESSRPISLTQSKTLDSPPPPANGAFAKILDEAKKDSQNGKTETSAEKSGENTSETSKNEKEITRYSQEKKELEKDKSGDKQNQSGEKNEGENAFTSQFFNFQPSLKNNSEFSAPPARSILHIADLERIISTIRAEKFQTTSQALITLKNSILKGLQIKLTIAENGKLKAEFIALNKQIKKQIESRKKELQEIFRSRALNLSEIEVLTEQN